MDKYHVHVYIVQALGEVGVDAVDPKQARDLALKQVGKIDFTKPDCHYIAIAFREEE